MELDDVPMEPCDGDYIIADVRGGWAISEWGFRGITEKDTFEEALDFVLKRMNAEQYWTDVWQQSDHGNLHLIDDLYGR